MRDSSDMMTGKRWLYLACVTIVEIESRHRPTHHVRDDDVDLERVGSPSSSPPPIYLASPLSIPPTASKSPQGQPTTSHASIMMHMTPIHA